MSRRAYHAQLGDPLRVEPRVFWPLFDTIRTAPFLADFAVWSDGHIRAPHFLLASCVHGLCPGGERSQDPCIAQQSVINPYRTQDHSGIARTVVLRFRSDGVMKLARVSEPDYVSPPAFYFVHITGVPWMVTK